jgi:hypothetical protein
MEKTNPDIFSLQGKNKPYKPMGTMRLFCEQYFNFVFTFQCN